MKLSLIITFPAVASSALAAPLAKRHQEEWAVDKKAWNLEDKRNVAVDHKEDTTRNWAPWVKEEKRTDKAMWHGPWSVEDKREVEGWGGQNWALEERSEEGSLLLRPCGWGVEDERRAGDCPPQRASNE
ncbi:uncharacterized protein SCHCODRAFT_02678245 [Schizophyllum commune H4-8]|uniref:Secreted protein n=1 Tax=Schizophyllum commune (strain H4-8 / FGSC 9210) TaxID=578458 RepID=D8Q5B6_SCHCM|nr:uncharacterized protein SCHCODRAFT_02678245 [Schizophyllum commune H4-8]KAI5892252.1 hypothetical protein SCHCODRAFT_02678245 [Schizophyllum commune H4-8]